MARWFRLTLIFSFCLGLGMAAGCGGSNTATKPDKIPDPPKGGPMGVGTDGKKSGTNAPPPPP